MEEGSAPKDTLPDSLPLAAGTRLGRYDLAVAVREDDAGSVWLAREPTAGGSERLVALRIASRALALDSRFRELLRQEVKLARGAAHASLAQVLELGGAASALDGSALYVASEWVDGETLADLRAAVAASRVRIPLAITLRILADALAGLHAAHLLRERGGGLLNVVHADVSARSLVVGKDGVARVVDLGFMKARARQLGGANFAWAERGRAPGQRIDRHADVWAIGAVLDQALEGLRGPSGRAANPKDEPPGVLRDLVHRARSLDPQERFATAAEMEGAVEAAMMTLGIATSHATVAAFADAHVGARTRARAEALRVARSSAPPRVLSIPTPPVDSVAATVRTLASSQPLVVSTPPRPFVVSAPPRVDTAIVLAHTPSQGTESLSPVARGRRRSVRKQRLAAAASAAAAIAACGGFLLLHARRAAPVVATAPVAVPAPRAPSEAPAESSALGASPPASPPPSIAPPAAPSCPAGMVAVAASTAGTGALAPFCLDAAPVTVDAYKACSEMGDCKRAATENRWPGITARDRAALDPLCRERDPAAHARDPVNCVDREMAALYCAARGARLPSEQEAALVTHDVDARSPGASPTSATSQAGRPFSEWSLRPHEPPGNRSYAIGFRCARSL